VWMPRFQYRSVLLQGLCNVCKVERRPKASRHHISECRKRPGRQSVATPVVTNMNLHPAVHIPLTIDEDKLIEGSVTVLSIIRPTWTKENVNFKERCCCIVVYFKIKFECVVGGVTELYCPSFLCGVMPPQMSVDGIVRVNVKKKNW
jgi:hypothetical protein